MYNIHKDKNQVETDKSQFQETPASIFLSPLHEGVRLYAKGKDYPNFHHEPKRLDQSVVSLNTLAPKMTAAQLVYGSHLATCFSETNHFVG